MVVHEPTHHDDEGDKASDMEQRSFANYFEQHQSRPPRAELTQVVEQMRAELGDLQDVVALEIGAGAMVESRYLLEAGVGHLDAYDASADAEARAIHLTLQHNDFEKDERFTFHRVRNEDLPEHLPQEQYDLIISYLTLQFTDPAHFDASWQALLDALRPGGRLSIQLAGDRHGWARQYPGMTFVDRDRLADLLSGLDEVHIQEHDIPDRPISDGTQTRWHDFWVTAHKPQALAEDSRYS